MREIDYACPYCNHRFRDKYPANKINCRFCGSNLDINWFKNGKKECGVVENTLVCFWGASGSIDLPNEITTIGNGVFKNSPKLTEVIFSNSIQEIGENAFYFCFRLQNVQLPDSLKIIRKKAFCSAGIQRLYIPKSVELIEEDAFDACPLIKEITVHKDNPYYYVKNDALIDKRNGRTVALCCKNKIYYNVTLDSNAEGEKPKKFRITNFCEFDKNRITQALTEVEQDDNKFIVCEADTPINNITYLQAINDGDEMHIEFHLQKSIDDTVWENWFCRCNLNKCIDYFFSFIRGEFAPNFDEWELCVEEE